MTSKPKTILFSNIYTLKNGKLSPCFKSQAELAQLIFEKTETYGTLISLQNFLGQTLKANDEKGAKPLPVALKTLILEITNERLENFIQALQIRKELEASFDYWKADKTAHDLKGDQQLLDTVKLYIEGAKGVVLFLPRPIVATDKQSTNLLSEFYGLIDPYSLSSKEKKSIIFFPSMGAAKAFWDICVLRISAYGAYDWEYGNRIFADLNYKGLIRTFVVAPEHCSIPLLAFVDNNQIDTTVESENIISFSIGNPHSIPFLEYSAQDARYILENKIRPMLQNVVNKENMEEFIYKREW